MQLFARNCARKCCFAHARARAHADADAHADAHEHTLQLNSIHELFDHVMLENKKLMSNDVRLRKRAMLSNFLKYWNTKSSALGTLLDQAAIVKSQQDFQLARMHGSVSDTVNTMNEIDQEA